MLPPHSLILTHTSSSLIVPLLPLMMVPEHTLKLFQILAIRVKIIPSILVSIYFILFLLQLISVQFYVVLFGTLVSWVYIRFFKVQDGIVGDRSEMFALASFFPEIFHPVIKPVSNAVYALFVAVGMCAPLANTNVLPMTATFETGVLATAQSKNDTADAERRRALALKALDQRLQQNQVVTPAEPEKTPETSL
ncbi:hypothetical protein HK096_005389 [Nowakowskiella sp. JEL0078]|nr:hypothetical protein HK096_005389 [Nowakowskiella sp. JEL0078]